MIGSRGDGFLLLGACFFVVECMLCGWGMGAECRMMRCTVLARRILHPLLVIEVKDEVDRSLTLKNQDAIYLKTTILLPNAFI